MAKKVKLNMQQVVYAVQTAEPFEERFADGLDSETWLFATREAAQKIADGFNDPQRGIYAPASVVELSVREE
jgi:hypothetical protein